MLLPQPTPHRRTTTSPRSQRPPASHMSDFLGPGLLDSVLAPSAGLWARTRLLIWMPPSSSSACSTWPGLSPPPAPWGRGACRTSVQKRVRGPWSSQKWQRATMAFMALEKGRPGPVGRRGIRGPAPPMLGTHAKGSDILRPRPASSRQKEAPTCQHCWAPAR